MDQEDQENNIIPITTETCMQQDDSSQINISDVIEVIQTTDPDTAIVMFPGGEPMQSTSQTRPTNGPSTSYTSSTANRHNAYVEITEQPAPKAIRFRYECEGRSAGSIPGVHSTQENKTHPSIRVVNYVGRAVVVVSCVTKDEPYKPHPHRLVGKEGCKKGVCTIEINSETMSVTFSNLGIQCVKKKDIDGALRLREEIRVDPYKTGFAHRNQPSSIDLNAVRLCFQVFLEGENVSRFTVPLPPVVSDPIYDKKGTSELTICKMSECSASVAGGKEIILLCEKVAKEDIKVRFFEQENIEGGGQWEAYGDFNHTNVHKQVAISFKVPPFKTLHIDKPTRVYIQLKRPSDDVTSEPLPFDYLPLDSDPIVHKRKRQMVSGDANKHIYNHMMKLPQHKQEPMPGTAMNPGCFSLNIHDPSIKMEPRDTSPIPNIFGGSIIPGQQNYRVPQGSPSPQPNSPGTPSYLNQPSPPYIGYTGMLQNNFNDNIPGSQNMNITPNLYPYENYTNLGGDNNLTPLISSLGGGGNNGGNGNNNGGNGGVPSQWNIQTPSFSLSNNSQQQFKHNIPLNNLSSSNPFHENFLPTASSTTGNNQNMNNNNNNNPSESMNISDNISNSNLFMYLDSHPVNSTELVNLLQPLGPTAQDVTAEQNRLEEEQENMTDSFNRLTTISTTIKEIEDLNKYNRHNNNNDIN